MQESHHTDITRQTYGMRKSCVPQIPPGKLDLDGTGHTHYTDQGYIFAPKGLDHDDIYT